jgi:hypothetical protein
MPVATRNLRGGWHHSQLPEFCDSEQLQVTEKVEKFKIEQNRSASFQPGSDEDSAIDEAVGGGRPARIHRKALETGAIG